MLERAQDQISVPTPDGDAILVDRRHHRAQVVRRLLSCGVSADTLLHLLPEWSELITRIDHELHSIDLPRQQDHHEP